MAGFVPGVTAGEAQRRPTAGKAATGKRDLAVHVALGRIPGALRFAGARLPIAFDRMGRP